MSLTNVDHADARSDGAADERSSVPPMIDLDRLEQELDDVEVALACLSRESDDLCATCGSARADGTLDSRPALAACAVNKFPAEIPLDL